MSSFLLKRTIYDKEGTPGKLFINGDFFCFTLERPKNYMKHPCIPEGMYKVVADNTGKFRYFRLLDVPNRSNIEIHPGNCIDDILGCILLGSRIGKEANYKYWLYNSKKTCDEFKAIVAKEFWLKITSDDSECSLSDF